MKPIPQTDWEQLAPMIVKAGEQEYSVYDIWIFVDTRRVNDPYSVTGYEEKVIGANLESYKTIPAYPTDIHEKIIEKALLEEIEERWPSS